MSDRPSPEAIERLRTVEATSDGFELAEHDLRLRGPGEYAGTRQSGWSQMKVATPSDLDLIELCQAEARLLLEQDPVLDAAEHRVLKRELLAFAEGRPAELS
jgi:ATP-dependent DNA helicase RecG